MAFQKFPFPKDPDHTLDYSVDLTDKCGADAIDPVVECQSDNAADLTITNVIIKDGVVSCFVSGGVAGQKYNLYFGAKFSDGIRNDGETGVLPIKER